MRIWGAAHPRLLNNKHLLGEHREVHALLNDDYNWSTNPEYHRFQCKGGRIYLYFRHELLRLEMKRRFGLQHKRKRHLTPIDSRVLPKSMVGYLAGFNKRPADDEAFKAAMTRFRFPPAALGADTPWERDHMTLRRYTRIGESWSKAKHHV